MRTILALPLLFLAGCMATFDGLNFDNRVACTVAGDKAVVVSEYGGRVGVSSTISDKDAAVICKK